MKDIVYLAFTFDGDHDHSGDKSIFANSLTWRGIEEGIPLVTSCLRGYKDSFGSTFKTTWFVRVDNQIKTFFGDSAYLLEKYKTLWGQLEKEGDALGWHSHLYRRKLDEWEQEDRPLSIDNDLREGFQAASQKGYHFKLSRIGGAYGSNQVMQSLDELGIQLDSSAMPGRKREDTKMDWLDTPQKPYYPSIQDYRKPLKVGNRAILEVPLSMVDMQTSYDKTPLKRYINLAFRNQLMKEGLHRFISENNLLVTITHPFEIMPNKEQYAHPLLSFNPKEMQNNIEFIISECKQAEKQYQFITLDEIYKNKNILH